MPADLADRGLQGVVGDPGVDQPAGEVGHGLQPEQVGDHPADLVLDELEVGEGLAELAALLDVVDGQVKQLLGGADRPGAEADAAVVEDLHRDAEAVAGLAEDVLGGDADVLEVEAAQVVAAQAHRVEALADLQALHPLLQHQRDVLVAPVHLAAGEGGDHVGARAVADVALLAVQHPRAVGLLDGARLDLVRVRARLGLGQGEGRELAPGGQVGQPSLLLLVGAEQGDALVADRLVHPEHDRQGGVDLPDRLEHARVAGLGQALAAVSLVHVEAQHPDLAEVADDLVRNPALLLDAARVVVLGAVLAKPAVEVADPLLLVGVGRGPGKDQLLVDLAQEQRLGEGRDFLLGLGLGLLGYRFPNRHPRSAYSWGI